MDSPAPTPPANAATEVSARPALPEPLPPLTPEVLAAFQKLKTHAERKAYFLAHPELRRRYSPVNFH